MNCSDYSTAWVCRACGSLVSLGYDAIGLGREVVGIDEDGRGGGPGFSVKEEWAAGPGGEYCRVCRAQAEAESQGRSTPKGELGATLQLERTAGGVENRGADLDVVAVPFVFRLLVAELSAMGIQVTIGLD